MEPTVIQTVLYLSIIVFVAKGTPRTTEGNRRVLVLAEITSRYLVDAEFWYREGRREIERAQERLRHFGLTELKRPRNILVFVGDGMGLNTVTAARIRKGQKQGRNGEESLLAWERFPNLGLLKVTKVDSTNADFC